MTAAISLLMLVLTAWTAGTAAIRLLVGRDPAAGHDLHVLTFGAGLGVLSLFVSAIGWIPGVFHPGILWGFLVAGTATGAFLAATTLRRNVSEALRPPPGLFSDRLALLGLLPAALLFAAELPLAALPPVEGDVTGYHFFLPTLYLRDGHLTHHPEILYNAWPRHVETLFIIALGTGGEASARALGWTAAAAWAAAFVAHVARNTSPRTAVLALLLTLAVPIIPILSASGQVDLFIVLYAQLALGVIDLARVEPEGRRRTGWIALAGLLAGFAIGVKWTGGIAAVLLAGCVLFDRIPLRTSARRWAELALFTAAALPGPAVWWFRNAIEYGNPLWPWMFDAFGGRYLSSDLARFIWEFHRREFGAGEPAEFRVLLPRLLRDLTPFLAFVPLALLRHRGGLSGVRRWALLAVAGTTLWAVISPQYRFLLPVLPWALAAAAHLLRIAAARWPRPGTAVLAVALLFTVYRWSVHVIPEISAGVSGIFDGREAYLARQVSLRGLRDIPRIREATGPDDRILLHNAPIGYYLPERRTLNHLNIIQPLIDYTRIRTPDRLRDTLRDIGVGFVYLQEESASDFTIRRMTEDPFYLEHTGRAARIFREMLDRYGETVFVSGGNRLVRIP